MLNYYQLTLKLIYHDRFIENGVFSRSIIKLRTTEKQTEHLQIITKTIVNFKS